MAKAKKKPRVRLVGKDSNVFNLMAITARALKDAGMHEEKKALIDRITKCGSYSDALNIIQEYVEVE